MWAAETQLIEPSSTVPYGEYEQEAGMAMELGFEL